MIADLEPEFSVTRSIQERTVLHCTSQEKDQDQNFKYYFYEHTLLPH